jgi:hypothetical protein
MNTLESNKHFSTASIHSSMHDSVGKRDYIVQQPTIEFGMGTISGSFSPRQAYIDLSRHTLVNNIAGRTTFNLTFRPGGNSQQKSSAATLPTQNESSLGTDTKNAETLKTEMTERAASSARARLSMLKQRKPSVIEPELQAEITIDDQTYRPKTRNDMTNLSSPLTKRVASFEHY